MYKRIFSLVLLCLISIMLCSCASTYKAHKMSSIAPSEVAYIVPYNKFEYYILSSNIEEVVVTQIDGKELNLFGNPKKIEILPGEHVLNVIYSETKIVANTTRKSYSTFPLPIVINAEKGHTYAIKPVLMQKDDKKTWEPVVTDITGEKGDPRLKK